MRKLKIILKMMLKAQLKLIENPDHSQGFGTFGVYLIKKMMFRKSPHISMGFE